MKKKKYTWGTDSRETLVTFWKLSKRQEHVTSVDILKELWDPFEKAPDGLVNVIIRQLIRFRKRAWIKHPEGTKEHPKEYVMTPGGESAAEYYYTKVLPYREKEPDGRRRGLRSWAANL